jgi:hypothetical protein
MKLLYTQLHRKRCSRGYRHKVFVRLALSSCFAYLQTHWLYQNAQLLHELEFPTISIAYSYLIEYRP